MNADHVVAPSFKPRELLHALLLTSLWTAFLILLTRSSVANYFPSGDEWALLANANLNLVSPLSWWTQGFSDYFVHYPGLSDGAYSNFIRPFFNVSYWILDQIVGHGSGAYLYLNYASIGACAGLSYLCMRQHANPSWSLWTLGLAAAMPFMSAFLPVIWLLFVPCMAYDPLTACICMLAYLAYNQGRIFLTGAILFVAVFTKETALPVALAFPTLFLLSHSRALSSDSGLRLRLIALAAPTLAWLVLRVAVFQDLAGGTYVVDGIPSLRHTAYLAVRWPFWFEPPPLRDMLALEWGWGNLSKLLLFAANAGLMTASLIIVGRRLRVGQRLDAAELCFLFSWAFMLLVGQYARFGAVLGVFLGICVARWLQRSAHSLLAALLAISLTVGLLVNIQQTWRSYAPTEAYFLWDSQVAKRYVSKLKEFAPGEHVLVLNDPTTHYSAIKWLRADADIPSDVVKLSDFFLLGIWFRPDAAPCRVSLEPLTEPRRFVFRQSCGIELPGVRVPVDAPAHMHLPGLVSVDYLPERESAVPGEQSSLRWRSFTFSLERGDVHLLYFDPSTNDFHQVYVR